ncbi:MAG TPA: aminopeptidase P family protein [Candidatus Omnitrophica bacterium]|nr:aminopeptidase P family protein [Candidatus Omnitrophota bacterium]
MPQAKNTDLLMVASSETDQNMYYATRFLVPDDFVYFRIRGKSYALMSDLEVDRARKEAAVDEIVSISDLARTFSKKENRRPSYMELISWFALSKKAKSFKVPENFPLYYADSLRKQGLKIEVKTDPFFEERTLKTPQEAKAIETAIRNVETAFGEIIAFLKKAKIKGKRIYAGKEMITSESLRARLNARLLELDCVGPRAIIACGKHAVDPHDEGSGPIEPNQSIIFDIFPRHMKSRYHADFSRTVVKGKASPKLKAMYAAVYEGQEIGFKMIKPGVDASTVHEKIQKRFEALGFKTGNINGRMQGFFHGTGHGLGLDVHEQPRVGRANDILKPGHVVTVEPGLYYEGIGGVRLEDVVLVTKTGCRNLTRFPRFLEIA